MKAQKTKLHILTQAKSSFIEKGYANITMTDIVNASGISRGGVYRYFQSKKDVFTALMELEIEQKSEVPLYSLDSFLEMQREELLHIDASLRVAGYEFMAQEATSEYKKLAISLYTTGIQDIYQVLDSTHYTEADALDIFLMLEGLTVMAITGILSEEVLVKQLHRIQLQYGA